MDLFLACGLAIAGLVFGSFLNVCINRIPHDESIVSPGSHCPRCGKPVRWQHNVPIVSFVWLKGRCADCRQTIALRYPLVEFLTAALFVACFAKFGLGVALVKFCVLSFLLVGLIFMDAETGLLPAEFTYTGMLLGLIFAWLAPGDSTGTEFLLRMMGIQSPMNLRQTAFLDAVVAMLVGAAFFYSIWAVYYLVRKRHGLGFGDIALIAMCGAFLGLKLTLFVLFTAPILGAVYASGLLLWNAMGHSSRATTDGQRRISTAEMLRGEEVPFGVFLGACSLAAMFIGEAAWRHYLAWFAG
jgi:leader peptidase (prepilin peptidase) / N-methyltransferase